jgi:RNA polymerase sigma-70 factor, ECF subfamily
MLALGDGELVRRIASGSGVTAAEAELCRRFAARVRLYGLRHLRDDERARDLVQTVLLSVLQAVRSGRVDDPDRIDRFVLGTCRNIASRVRQTEARAQPTEHEELDMIAAAPPPETIGTGALVRCLAGLDERARRVVYLSFRDERTADEIATTLETTPGNVRVLRHRAVAALRRCLDEHREVAP